MKESRIDDLEERIEKVENQLEQQVEMNWSLLEVLYDFKGEDLDQHLQEELDRLQEKLGGDE